MKKHSWIRQLRTLYGLLVVLLFWYVLHLLIETSAIPSPFATIGNFIEIFPGELSIHLLVSFLRILVAIVISLIAGTIIGLWIGMSKKADELLSPIVYILYPLPKIAFLPILMILFGLGNTPKIVLIITIVIFQIIVAVRDGVQEIPKELFYSVKSLGVNKLEMYRHLIMPSVLPKIITAIRISVGVSISVLFYGENFATTYGIGYFIMDSWIKVNYVEMFSGILALSIMGFVIFKVIDFIEFKVCGWIRIGK
ncbi:ABC transporter permease [Niallia sp. XMNu-256]|uniref:ABC transporter permease n=1 Tax=Niallia sp. XMNu-256 TaxID=3082444 RepID=UPI0030CEF9E1